MTVLDVKTVALHRLGKEDGAQMIRDMPGCFGDFKLAQMYWELVERRAAHFLHVATASAVEQSVSWKQKLTTCTDHSMTDFASSIQTPFNTQPLPQTFQEERARHAGDLTRWQVGARGFLRSADLGIRAAAMSQYVHASATRLLLEAMLVLGECGLDRFLPEYKAMLSMTKQVLKLSQPTSPTAGFTIDTGVLPAMYVTVLMCRHQTTRRDVIATLRGKPRREGIWDSRLIAELGTWIMTLEEEGALDGFIPELARVRLSKVEVNMHSKVANLKCMRRVAGKDGLEVLETTVQWD